MPASHSHTRRLATPLLLALGLGARASAQTPRTVRSDTHEWLDLTADAWFTRTLGLQGEALIERTDLGTEPQSTELRLGVQRAFGSSVRLAVGGTFIHTSRYGPFPARAPFDEYRSWLQATIEQRFAHATLSHRYRAEERWIERPVATGPSDIAFALRARYQARLTVPLAPPTRPRSPYVALSDEVFLVAGPHAPNNLLDQNRAYGGLGVRWSPMLRAELGYLNQAILRSNGTQVENNHTLQLSLALTRAASR